MAGIISSATEAEILTALCSVMGATTGLKCYRVPDPSMTLPAAVPLLAPEYEAGLGGTMRSPIEGRVLVMVSPGDYVTGALLLLDYLGATGPRSIKAAIDANPTLGGVVTDCQVKGPTTDIYERYDVEGSLVVYGRHIRVLVYP